MKVLVTGASGFVGGAVWRRLNAMNDIQTVAAVRRVDALAGPEASAVAVGELSAHTDWSSALDGVAAVVHTAARVHVMQDAAADPLAEYRRVNVEGALNLARQAAAAGVRRFVFLSSVKVNGEATPAPHPGPLPRGAREQEREKFTAYDVPAPQDAYGISKWEAEQGLREIAAQTGMAVVIIRPPLVYGPGVRANFRSLMRAVACGWPLPLGAIDNRRSVVGLDNLVDFIVTCVRHPKAANETFLVSDGDDVSTPELVRRLARAMGRPARLIPVPVWMLEAGAALLGRRAAVQRLCGSLQVDGSKARQLLGWAPPLTLDEGLRLAVQEYLREASV